MPILWHALTRIVAVPQVRHIACVIPQGWEHTTKQALTHVQLDHCTVNVVVGGVERHDSVQAGLAALPPECEVVLVHDAARCLAPPQLFEQVIHGLVRCHAVIPGLPVADTIKQVSPDSVVVATPARSTLRAIQTPQGFTRELLMRAHSVSVDAPTDDAMLVEHLGEPVLVIEGHPLARKVTTAEDLAWAAEAAQGYDSVVAGRLLRKA